MKITQEQYVTLMNRMLKLLSNKPYNANRNHVNKIAAQMRYLERFIPMTTSMEANNDSVS